MISVEFKLKPISNTGSLSRYGFGSDEAIWIQNTVSLIKDCTERINLDFWDK